MSLRSVQRNHFNQTEDLCVQAAIDYLKNYKEQEVAQKEHNRYAYEMQPLRTMQIPQIIIIRPLISLKDLILICHKLKLSLTYFIKGAFKWLKI